MVKVALLIGVSEYEPGLNPLPGAVKDVEAMEQVLLHPEMGDFAEADIMVLKNPQRQDKVIRQRETNQPQVQQSNTYEPPVTQSHSIDFLEEVKADELPTQFLSRRVNQVIPNTELPKTLQLLLKWIFPLILFVVAAGCLGLFVKQLRSQSGRSPIFSNPLQTQNPTIEPTPAARSLANLSPGWVIQTNNQISLGNNQSLPPGQTHLKYS
jgi:hypothetical protein